MDEGRMPHILVIEDEPTVVEFLRTGLAYEGYRVTVAEDGRSGYRLAQEGDYDLLVLDLMLPDLDGVDLCRRLRAEGKRLPILMLTARKSIPERVEGLDAGADDYLTKPYSFDELLARIRALLRRSGGQTEPTRFRAGPLLLDTERHEVWKGDEPIHLTPTEFALLELFMRHPRRLFTKETLLNRIWGYDYGSNSVVEVHISHLRRKIGDREGKLIRTVFGVGYRFEPPEADDAAA